MSRALVYNYFGDKGGLLAAVYLRSLRRLDEALGRAVDPCLHRLGAAAIGRAVLPALRRRELHGLAPHRQHRGHGAPRRDRGAEPASTSWPTTGAARRAPASRPGPSSASSSRPPLDWIDRGDVDLERIAELLYTILWSGLSAVDDREAHLPGGETAATVIG